MVDNCPKKVIERSVVRRLLDQLSLREQRDLIESFEEDSRDLESIYPRDVQAVKELLQVAS